MGGRSAEPLGEFCLVLHTHLPWLARHGSWPVGEEWLYQAWADSYLPLIELLEHLAAEGLRDQLALGVTPVLAAQLDDPYSLRGLHDWLGDRVLRTRHAAVRWQQGRPELRALAAAEHRRAVDALGLFETRWRHGASPLLRPLVDSGVIELLGGPATHPFQPLLHPRLRAEALRVGLADGELRRGSRGTGIWAPECGFDPGMELGYADAGVTHFLVDSPALAGRTSAARPVWDSEVVCFGRDGEIAERVWSPKVGYPGHPAYRDFHTYDHPTGLKPARVTGRTVAPEDKQPYLPDVAAAAVAEHVADFVDAVVTRLREHRDAADTARPPLVVAAFDTELFGHWWHEGPAWLAGVLRGLPEAGVTVTTPRRVLAAGHVGAPVELPASSWGSGKDWRVWNGPAVADLVADNDRLQHRLLAVVDGHRFGAGRDRVLDQLWQEALLACSSDWAFMVTRDSAADYARARAAEHTAAFDRLADLVEAGDRAEAEAAATRLRVVDGPFGALDARGLLRGRGASH
ncbi:1,4-alpha-glucan branching protein domain-containing protein [Actinoalloteichus hoggarensis]|uniref:1,4-alpha-glucan branching protein domain-containing protein n=1 Tax=Actinoalloteichus hoggarensis TaxID=1470176 RepID=UPI000B8B76F9|nr:glycoside hydrolase family 57 protein [Actinoalloteichus hoggarensis]